MAQKEYLSKSGAQHLATKMKDLVADKVTFTNDTYVGAVIPTGGSAITEDTIIGWGFAKLSDIPSDTYINSLIDAKLGEIENGTY